MRYLKLLAVFLAIIVCEPAFATNLFEPVANDKSMYLFSNIFGKLEVFGMGNDALVAGITMFLGAVLSIGGLIAAYTVLAGTLGTAHDGEMLGKKFSSVWIPIRYSFGVAFILPVINGYCVIQLIVGWTIVQSIGLADNVWSSFVSSDNIQNVAMVGSTNPSGKNLAFMTLQSLACQNVISSALAEEPVLSGGSSIGITIEENLTNRVIKFGDRNEVGGFKNDTCGRIQVSKYQALVSPSNNGLIGKVIDAQSSAERMVQISEEHWIQVNTMIASLNPLAKTLVESNKPIQASQVDTIIATYEQAVRKSAAQAIIDLKPFEELSKNAQQDGWIMAGAWPMKISSLQDLTDRSVANTPTSSGPSNFEVAYIKDKYDSVMVQLQKTIENSTASNIIFGVGNEAGGSNTSWSSTLKEAILNGFDPTLIIKKAFTSTTNYIIQDGENPLLSMKRLGNYLLATASIAWTSISLTSSTLGNAPGIGLTLQAMTLILIPPMLVVGVLLSYVLPMLPFFMWVGAVLGWIIMCIEAIVVAPMWWVMLLVPNGDDLMGSSKAGFSLLLGLILRPVLMVFGLMAAIILTEIFGGFLNLIYADVFALSQQESSVITWIIGSFIAGPLVYGILMFIMSLKTYSCIHVVPDQVLSWFGGGHAQLGGTSESFGGDRSTAFIAMNNFSGQLTSKIGNNSAITNPDNPVLKDIPDASLKGNKGIKESPMGNESNESKTGETFNDMLNKKKDNEEES